MIRYKDMSPAAYRLRIACGFRVQREQILVDRADVMELLNELHYPPVDVEQIEPDDLV